MNKRNVLILLTLIILLGSFLRIYKIGSESFWTDETATLYTTYQKPLGIINDIYTTTKVAPSYFEHGGQLPTYYLLSNYWTKLVGLSEAKLRLLAAIFGIIDIYFIFVVGNLIFDDRVGLVSAFIFSINYLQINYSQEARSYTFGIFLTLLSVYFLLNALKQSKFKFWVGYVLVATLLIYTHYFGAFILLFEYIFILIFFKDYRKCLKEIVISGVAIFILYLPWLPVLMRQVSDKNYLNLYFGKNILWDIAKIFVQFNSWITPDFPTRVALREIYHSFNMDVLASFFHTTFLGLITILCVLGITLVLGICFIAAVFKNKKIGMHNFKNKNVIFVLLWLLIPIVVPVIITLIFPQSPVFGFVQYAIFASPAYYLLASKGIVKSKKYTLLLSIIVLLSVLPLYSYYANFDKSQWREAASYLDANRQNSEAVLVVAPSNMLAVNYYHPDTSNFISIRTIDDIKSATLDKKSFWLILAGEQFFDPEGKIKSYTDKNYKIDKEKEFTGIKIFHYVK